MRSWGLDKRLAWRDPLLGEIFRSGKVLYEAVMRLLTPENRRLLAIIAEKKPASVAELARLLRRAEPNVSRTLGKLVAAGFVRLRPGAGRTKVPEVAIRRLAIDIDVCHETDRVAVA